MEGWLRGSGKLNLEDFRVNIETHCSYRRSQVIADMALILLCMMYNRPRGEFEQRRHLHESY